MMTTNKFNMAEIALYNPRVMTTPDSKIPIIKAISFRISALRRSLPLPTFRMYAHKKPNRAINPIHSAELTALVTLLNLLK